jgi:ureidoglycolate lyase
LRTLPLEPLTAVAFAPFGDVIDAQVPCEQLSINDDRTLRHHALAAVDCAAGGGSAAISLFRATPVAAAFTLRRLERHPLGSQAFINVSGQPFAVVVAPPGDLEEAQIRGFLAAAGQSVSYHRGVWHHYLLALHAAADFVVVDRIGPGDNCDEQALRTPLRLALPG